MNLWGIGLLLGWLLVWQEPIQAQTLSFQGQVREQTTQVPIQAASVLVCRTADSLIIAFVRTDATGRFTIGFVPEAQQTYFIKVTHISYHEAIHPLSLTVTPIPAVDILLTPGSLVLKEVQVTAQIPVREQGDSTRYKVDAFRNGAEQTLEEVLKKMPNVRVEENGDVYFKNKRVDKVFIDGDDLVGNAYQLATRSINPAVLNEVQAIENFSENKLLRKIEQGDKTVLNLTVKDNRKTRLFGVADGGLGPQRYNGIGNLFSYSKNMKAFSVLSANNIGTRRLDLNDNAATVLTDDRPTSEQLIRPFAQTARPFSRNLNSTLENLNNERVATVNVAVEPIKTLKITANLSLLKDKVQGGRTQLYQLIGDAPLRYQQADTLRQQPALAHLRLQANYELNKRTAVLYKGIIGAKTITLDQTTQFRSEAVASRFPQQFVNQLQDNRHVLELTHKRSDTQAVVLSLQATDTRLTEQYNAWLNPALLTAALTDTAAGTSLFNQVINQHNQLYSGQLRWLYGTKTRKFEQQIGYTDNRFSADIQQQNGGLPVSNSALSLNRQTIFSRTTGKITWPTVEVTGMLQLSYVRSVMNELPDSRSLIQANATLSYRLTSLSRLVLAYDRQVTPVSNTYLIDQTVVTDFRSAQRGYRGVLFDERNQVSLTYLFTDVARRRMTLLISSFATRSNNFWNLADLRFSPDYSITSLINTPNVYTLGLISTLEKLVYPLSGNIRVGATMIQNQTRQYVNGQLRDTHLFTPTLTAKYISVFESPFNVEIGGTYKPTLLMATQNDQSFRQTFATANGYAQFFYRRKVYQLNTTVEANRIQQNNYLFLKASATWQLTPKLTLRAEAMNLLNHTTYSQVALTPTTYSVGVYPLLPSMTLLYARYNF